MLQLPQRFAEEIIAHAREEAPNECCGILSGSNGRILRLHRTANAERSPYRFDIDRRDLNRIYAEVQAAGQQLLAIYHSHPSGEARPSRLDLALAQTTQAGESVVLPRDVVHLIVSLSSDPPSLKAYRLEGGVATEEKLRLVN